MASAELTLSSLESLPYAAQTLLEQTAGETVYCFFGSMGAGKTTFIKALCAQLGVEDEVSSPTFSLVNEYRTAGGDKVYHFDFYRIENEEEVYDIGYEEYLYSGHRCFIEWPEKILYLLPERYVKVAIEEAKDNQRVLTFGSI